MHNYTINVIAKNQDVKSVRELKSSCIGSLVKVRGIVTKITQVKPSVKVATYICESCGTEIYQTIENDTFDALEECFSEKCKTRKIKSTLCLVTRGSKFVKFQTLQLQELSSDVPSGTIPRILRVECYSTLTERVKPGEYVVLTGIFLPKPYYGLKRLKAGLLNDIFLHCTSIESQSMEHSPIPVAPMSAATLVDNFAPEIFGFKKIKKVLLLMLVGSTNISKDDGMKIRGNINVLLVGDPGIAKSQLLKTVVKISKRGVYTTGKGSSGVGLTASVTKDPITGEVVLEGGALVISDTGVCAIDELDKMNENDRVSIHEVMEQQTVSISKAGINTTLNARCAVLAAANPRGRFDSRKTIEQNIGLPISLISRFDVICVLKDDSDNEKDLELANHITSLHLESIETSYDYTFLKSYIERCKTINPVLPVALKERLVNQYLEARKDSSITPRYLLSLIRLSIAHARLEMRETVEESDVMESINILESTKFTVVPKQVISSKHAIYNFILSFVQEKDGSNIVNLNEMFVHSRYPANQVDDVIAEFEAAGVWMRNNEELIIFN